MRETLSTAVETSVWLRSIRPMIEEGRHRATRDHRPVLVSLTEPVPVFDPLAFYACAANRSADSSFWSAPNGELALVAAGSAWTATATGPDRFAELSALWRDCGDRAVYGPQPPSPATGPRALAGFSFDSAREHTALWTGYPDGLLVVPRLLLTSRPHQSWLTLNVLVSAQDDPERTAATVASEVATAAAGTRSAHDDGLAVCVPQSDRAGDAGLARLARGQRRRCTGADRGRCDVELPRARRACNGCGSDLQPGRSPARRAGRPAARQ